VLDIRQPPGTTAENDEDPVVKTGPSEWWRGQDLNLRPSGYENDATLLTRVRKATTSARFCGSISRVVPDVDQQFVMSRGLAAA